MEPLHFVVMWPANAAGIDVGASELFVAVSADRDPQSVRSFPTFTRDLNALADWLQQCGIRSVAMESTSVYWIPVYQILESRGLEVRLVNAQHGYGGRQGTDDGGCRGECPAGASRICRGSNWRL
jgi:transposase